MSSPRKVTPGEGGTNGAAGAAGRGGNSGPGAAGTGGELGGKGGRADEPDGSMNGGDGGSCPAEVPLYDVSLGGENPYASCCPQDQLSGPCCTGLTGTPCSTKNLICWVTLTLDVPEACPGGTGPATFQYRCDGKTFSATLTHGDPYCINTGGAGGGGAGGGSDVGGGGGLGGAAPSSP